MTAIGKGDFVEALRSDDEIAVGDAHLVIEIVPGDETEPCIHCGSEDDGFIVDRADCSGWICCPCSWRPISGGQPGMFDELLKAPADAPTREPVAA